MSVETVVCITDSVKKDKTFVIRGRIVDLVARASAERALIGSAVSVTYSGVLLPNMVVKTGILFRLSVPIELANAALDEIAEGRDAVIRTEPDVIRPMAEPCARVPLSLLRELRGQEAGTEMSRRALVKTWAEERRTGRKTG